MAKFVNEEWFEVEHCYSCGISFAMPLNFQRNRLRDRQDFWCPAGHPQHYIGKSEEQKLREQLQQVEHQRDRARMTTDQVRSERDAIAKAHRKMRVRVMNGVCPCCNRSFDDLRKHMATKHPDFDKPQTIKALRKAFGMTQAAVADEAGTKTAYVSLFENGRPVPVQAASSLNWWLERQGARA